MGCGSVYGKLSWEAQPCVLKVTVYGPQPHRASLGIYPEASGARGPFVTLDFVQIASFFGPRVAREDDL